VVGATGGAHDGGDADLLDAAIRVLAAFGDGATFATFRERHRDASNPQERLRFLGALADFPGDTQIDAFLAATITDEVRSQDAPFVLRRALTNRSQSARVWHFIAGHWDEIGRRFPTNSVSRMLEGIRTITDATVAADIEAFLDDHPVPQGAKPIDQHRERMRAGVALRRRVAAALTEALRTSTPS
jgi:puromycin-sensitive aminopeptidase